MSDTKSNLKGIEQGRATFAYNCAKAAKYGGAENDNLLWKRNPNMPEGKDAPEAKEYKSYVKKIPMMIKTNGLGATLAFIKSKPKKLAYKLIYEQLKEWFLKDAQKYLMPELKSDNDLVAVVIALESTQYRAVTVEVMALFGWLRRFAEGLIEGEAEGDDRG
jgi:CRISPR-associated protein Cmr5